MKMRTKIAKLQMHETLYKNVNENICFHSHFYAEFHDVLIHHNIRCVHCLTEMDISENCFYLGSDVQQIRQSQTWDRSS